MANLQLTNLLLLLVCTSCAVDAPAVDVRAVRAPTDIAQIAYGWQAELIARVDESYAGWDVEIGDADGDGHPEILTGTAPESEILEHRWRGGAWTTTPVLRHLAGAAAGLVLDVRIVDLDGDGRPEVIAGTGQEDDTVAQLALLHTDGAGMTQLTTVRSSANTSSYTHGLPTADLDGDGRLEVVSSYCGNGEVIRYDLDTAEGSIATRKVLQLSGSGEASWLVDVDGDGRTELVVSNGYRDHDARVQIHDLDPVTGDPDPTPRIVLDRFEDRRMFYASIVVGDLDGDGRPELVVAWKHEQDVNRATLVAYHVDGDAATVAYVIARDDAALDLSYFEKMIAIADLDGDGRSELIASTRGDGASEDIESAHLGHVFAYRLAADGTMRRDLLVDFDPRYVESSWLAVGDVDEDGVPDLVLATGRGDRTVDGTSWVMRLWRDGRDAVTNAPNPPS